MTFLIYMTFLFTVLQVKDTALGDNFCTYARTCYAATFKHCGTWGWSRCQASRTYQCNYQGCCSGWTGIHCSKPICNTACVNGGTCIAPNKCKCPSSHTGEHCMTATALIG